MISETVALQLPPRPETPDPGSAAASSRRLELVGSASVWASSRCAWCCSPSSGNSSSSVPEHQVLLSKSHFIEALPCVSYFHQFL